MSNDVNYILVITTCPGSISSKKVAQELVTEKLAACVNIVPGVQSFFSWVGKVDSANEHMLVIKSTLNNYAALEKRIKKIHPYELPEIIAVPIETGLAGYLDWISKNTK
ncbi:MAG: divalent-cation tolerance protein CutA [Proteobacteria bacterium]|nr:divalent-cation tolerance protein CutA [Pseudomonadota bacterium]NOG60508.1 divalent-cation tolerance protein CutA [Pseudomonadota bacterium]